MARTTSLGRGRPSVEQVKALERAILDSALQVFLEEGFAGAAMEGVAARANVTKVTVYARYPNKEKLFLAVIDDRIAAWAVNGYRRDLRHDLPTMLTHFATTFLRQSLTDDVHAFSTMILAEARRFPDLARRYYEQGYLLVLEQLREMIGALAEEQDRDDASIRIVCEAFLSQLSGWIQLQMLGGRPTMAECTTFAKRTASLFTVALSPMGMALDLQ